jgi:uncharacterized membrane protein YeiH
LSTFGVSRALMAIRHEFDIVGIALAGAALAYVARVERYSPTLLVFDAADLGLCTVAGTLKALDCGLGPVAATALGVTTAVRGGVLRDVIARETPTLIRSGSELYALPAAAGAAIVALAGELGVYGPLLGAVAAVAVFGVRGLALRRHWHRPHAQHSVS